MEEKLAALKVNSSTREGGGCQSQCDCACRKEEVQEETTNNNADQIMDDKEGHFTVAV